jgi:succinate dehydrogenase/fumarate reductase flavoprotein subunit
MINRECNYEWPYPIRYENEREVLSDILVMGGGIAGCWAAITAAKQGYDVALVDKGCIQRSGAGGAGVDHWQFVTDTPCCKIAAEELTEALIENTGGYTNGISRYIEASEGYDTLCELEQMGGKVRDDRDEFKGAPFRDEKTKLMFAYDYENKYTIRVWGARFKPILYKECQRLGIKMFERTMGTALLTAGGMPGSRVVGATALNIRTGEFYVFKARATILTNSRPQRNWIFSTELRGISSFRPANNVGNGHAMAWRAGAELAMMEKSANQGTQNSPYCYPVFGTGNPRNTWYPCTMVDAEGKEIPWVDRDGNILKTVEERCRPAPGQKFFLSGGGSAMMGAPRSYKYRGPQLLPDLRERITKGEYKLPLYADLPSMPDYERRVIFGVMVGSEGKSDVPVLDTYMGKGFDPRKHLLQSYYMLRGDMADSSWLQLQERTFGEVGVAGGLLVDWDLKTTLDGLYAAGDTLFGAEGHAHAAVTGRYAARCAIKNLRDTPAPAIHRGQVDAEKGRVYAPVKRDEGIEWKELNAGICRVMQNYCGEPKSEELLNIGLMALGEIRNEAEWQPYAVHPHSLGRTIDVLDIRTNSEIIIQACLARKAGSAYLGFKRTDYPDMDPTQWHKWLTIRREGDRVKTHLLPIDFWLQPPFASTYRENYESHGATRKRIYE